MDKYDELRNLLINSPDDIERWEKIENHIKNLCKTYGIDYEGY